LFIKEGLDAASARLSLFGQKAYAIQITYVPGDASHVAQVVNEIMGGPLYAWPCDSESPIPRSFYIQTSIAQLTMKLYTFIFALLVNIAIAMPQAGPKAKGGEGGACTSNAWEKVHEGHGHNIHDGTVGGANLGLKLPGGTGCYKGQKVGNKA
jgi:hypothetical protein